MHVVHSHYFIGKLQRMSYWRPGTSGLYWRIFAATKLCVKSLPGLFQLDSLCLGQYRAVPISNFNSERFLLRDRCITRFVQFKVSIYRQLQYNTIHTQGHIQALPRIDNGGVTIYPYPALAVDTVRSTAMICQRLQDTKIKVLEYDNPAAQQLYYSHNQRHAGVPRLSHARCIFYRGLNVIDPLRHLRTEL